MYVIVIKIPFDIEHEYNRTCIKKSPMRQGKSVLIFQVNFLTV